MTQSRDWVQLYGEKLGSVLAHYEPKIKEIFNFLDRDKNGYIDFEEAKVYEAIMTQANEQAFDYVSDLFKLDSDGDGSMWTRTKTLKKIRNFLGRI